MLCSNCIHSTEEIPEKPEELREIAEEMSKRYPVVLYCSREKVVVVGNPEKPTQRIDECEFFEAI